MRIGPLAVLVVAAAGAACNTGDLSSSGSGRCSSGQVCGFEDHKYFSTYYCGGMGIGLSWRSQDRCEEQCNSAAAWGCDVGTCDCSVDHGTGAWLPCTEANGGEQTSNGCFLSGSGMNGETVPCVCR